MTLAVAFDDGGKKTFWVLAAVILGFTLKGLMWLGLGGAIVAGWRRWRRGPQGDVLVEGSGPSERQALLDGEERSEPRDPAQQV